VKLAVEIAASILGLALLIGSYFVWAGMPPYVERDNHERDLQQIDVELAGSGAAFYEYQQFILRKDIRQQEQMKRIMLENPKEKQEWFKFYEEDLQNLKLQEEKNKKTIEKYEKRLEKKQ